MNEIRKFEEDRVKRIESYKNKKEFINSGKDFLEKSLYQKYSYNFSWLGRPIIQYPQDVIAIQEIIWEIKPDLIIETGIAHGGSLIFYASLLEVIGEGEVLGIDIEIRPHNKEAIEQHPMFKRITMLEGDSVSKEVLEQVKKICENKKRIVVFLDSNHTHDHVLKELEAYSPFVSVNSYLIVFDTIIEDIPEELSSQRPWGVGNSPKTALYEFLKNRDDFIIDNTIDNKLIITVAPDGYLKKIK